jgi:hypothetical protein
MGASVLEKLTASTFSVDDYSALKMEAADSFKTLININQNTRHHILEGCNINRDNCFWCG